MTDGPPGGADRSTVLRSMRAARSKGFADGTGGADSRFVTTHQGGCVTSLDDGGAAAVVPTCATNVMAGRLRESHGGTGTTRGCRCPQLTPPRFYRSTQRPLVKAVVDASATGFCCWGSVPGCGEGGAWSQTVRPGCWGRQGDRIPVAARVVPGPARGWAQCRGRAGRAGLLLSTVRAVGPALPARRRTAPSPACRSQGRGGVLASLSWPATRWRRHGGAPRWAVRRPTDGGKRGM